MGLLGGNMGLLGKIPGFNQLAQMGQMKKMAQSMQQGGGMGDLANMFGMGGGSVVAPKKLVDRDKIKKLRKAAKRARKKNRKK